MALYCLKCKKNTENKNRKVARTETRRIMFLLKCAVCNSKKELKIIKEQEARRLLSSLGVKAPLIKTPLVGPYLF